MFRYFALVGFALFACVASVEAGSFDSLPTEQKIRIAGTIDVIVRMCDGETYPTRLAFVPGGEDAIKAVFDRVWKTPLAEAFAEGEATAHKFLDDEGDKACKRFAKIYPNMIIRVR